MRVLPLLACLGVGCSIDSRPWSPEPEPEPELEPPPAWGAPLIGGTMIATRDGTRAVIADPDRDRVYIVDLAAVRVADTIQLPAGAEPGRVVEDGTGRFHIALRGSGQLLTITGGDHQLRDLCGEARGLAWQETGDLVHVACATGELVSVPAGGGDPVRSVRLERDLRDVIVRADGGLVVTTFRSATLLVIDAQGAVVSRIQPPVIQRTERPGSGGDILFAVGEVHDAVAAVAWRTIALADGRLLMLHQRRVPMTLETQPGGYGGGCGAQPVETAVTLFDPVDGGTTALAPWITEALPIDVAEHPVTHDLAIVTAGTRNVWLAPSALLATHDDDTCESATSTVKFQSQHATSAVAYTSNGSLLMFVPESAQLRVTTPDRYYEVAIANDVGADAGRDMFHMQTNSGLACASCHPEARDDGGVWTFAELGPRRTQSLGGGLLSRAPYHWGADMETLDALVGDVFARRMGGGELGEDDARALGAWLDRIPAPRGVVTDAAAVARGAALFDMPEVGCRSCHAGTMFTNNFVANVGLGSVKVPSLLGVGARAPFMHDGCAQTLRDRFGVCGGGDKHGHTSQLSAAEIDDLVAYLDSL